MDDFADIASASWAIDGPHPLSTFPELGPFVYYIQCGSFIKIGTSINPESRVAQLRRGGKAIRPSLWVGNPRLIAYLPGNVSKERELHREFAHARDNGEWFVINEELVEHVEDVQQQQCLMELDVHVKYRDRMVESGAWPATDADLGAMYQQHLATKDRIDPEWLEALVA